jgi:Transposase DDE domain
VDFVLIHKQLLCVDPFVEQVCATLSPSPTIMSWRLPGATGPNPRAAWALRCIGSMQKGKRPRFRATRCFRVGEAAGMMPHVPIEPTVDDQGEGSFFGREDFRYEPETDTYVCPGSKRLLRESTNHKDRYTTYKASSAHCGACLMKSRCTQAPRRGLARHLYEEALNRMQERLTPEAMSLRRFTVEHPFATPLDVSRYVDRISMESGCR